MTRYVIVGSGEAGTRAALALKARARADDRITLIGGEDGLPYERPPLSKPTADGTPRKLIAGNAAFEGIETLFGVGAERIDRNAKALHLADGRTLAYDRLLLATGARPRPLPCPGGEHALTLRTWQDAETIYAKAAAGARAVIVGAGLIGLELAAVLRQRGLSVTVLEAAPRAMQRALPEAIAEELVASHRTEGVEILFNARIAEVSGDGVILDDGERLPADLIVAAIGVLPNTSLAKEAGIDCDNGVLVDASLRTSDPDIFAAGDCAALDHPTFGRIRFESWRNACDMGDAAAAAMAGDPVRHTPGVWFWSDHYDLGLQMTGRFSPDDTIVRREIGNGFLLFALDPSGRLCAAAGIGKGNAVAKDIRLAEMLIGRDACPAPQSLQDPSLSLKTFFAPDLTPLSLEHDSMGRPATAGWCVGEQGQHWSSGPGQRTWTADAAGQYFDGT